MAQRLQIENLRGKLHDPMHGSVVPWSTVFNVARSQYKPEAQANVNTQTLHSLARASCLYCLRKNHQLGTD
jgi:hypothetical protein